MRWYTLVVLGIVIILYISLGGVIFSQIEKVNEAKVRMEVLQEVDSFIGENSCINISGIGRMRHLLKEMKAVGVRVTAEGQVEYVTRWDIRTSLFVAIQLIATIGFPSAEPESVPGKVFTIPYAVFGIPLFLVTAIAMGTLLHGFAEYLRIGMKKSCWRGRNPMSCGSRLFRTVFVALFGIVFFLIIPSIIFANLEPWSYADAMYFSFTTLATIGFGDVMPSYNDVPWMTDNYRNWYRLAIAFWILLLSSWFAGVIVSIHDHITLAALSTEEKIRLHSLRYPEEKLDRTLHNKHYMANHNYHEKNKAEENMVSSNFATNMQLQNNSMFQEDNYMRHDESPLSYADMDENPTYSQGVITRVAV